jgi:hypothetical protein
MIAHDSAAPTAHAPAGAEAGHETAHVHELVARCGGDPNKLARLLKTAPASQHSAIVAEAHKLYGMAFVQRAMAEQGPREEAKAPVKEDKQHEAKALSTDRKGPMAEAARIPADGGGGSSVSYSSSQSTEFNSGDVHISETVTCSVQHGEGAVNFDLNGGHLSIGNEKMNVDLKAADAATGKHLAVSGASVTIAHNKTSKSSTKVEDGYVGIEYETEWTVKGHHGWTAKFTMATFAGVKPPHHHKHWWQKIPIVSVVTAAVVSAIVAAAATIIATSPEWGPVVVLAL